LELAHLQPRFPILTFQKEETTREFSYFSLMSTFSTSQSIV
jgi:hypothetical protein